MHLTLTLVLLFSVARESFASWGDTAPEFETCIRTHTIERCSDFTAPTTEANFPLALRLTQWSCLDDIKYDCMHNITTSAIKKGEPVLQYYGKWPFWRFAGIQEPASVAFSLLNLWMHCKGWKAMRRRISETHPMRRYYLLSAVVNMNAWIWSAIFHTRGLSTSLLSFIVLNSAADKPLTEKLDYFSAALTIVYTLFYAVVRLCHLYAPPGAPSDLKKNQSAGQHPLLRHWASLCTTVYLLHITYLSILEHFDYTYNIIFNAIIANIHNLLWLFYSFPPPVIPFRRFRSRLNEYRPRAALMPATLVASMSLAMCLELFDFPPWQRTFDAHSLWHLATAPIVMYWYRFLIEDARDPAWREAKDDVLMSPS